jgi:type II secretory pathway pseudopilin PulG
LLEILVAVALLVIIFLFVTLDLIQSSQAENESATRTETMNAANYLLSVMRGDPNFWFERTGSAWTGIPGGQDPCGNPYPPYDDTILAPTWHQAPACAALFPDLAGVPSFQYMWNAQQRPGNTSIADLTVWVQIDEGGRYNIYEVHSTRSNITPPSAPPGSLSPPPSPPTNPPSVCPPPCTSPKPPSPTPRATGTSRPPPSPTPKPSPIPSGTFM